MKPRLLLTFRGAAGSTTGSRHLVTLDDKQFLFDCGFYQGRRKDTYLRNLDFQFEPSKIHSVLLSHAHIDHSGNLPNLSKQGFKGAIYCTPATEDLCRVMLRDSAFIQERDAEFISRRNRKRGRNGPVEPIYRIEDAEQCMELFRSVNYHRRFNLLHDVEVTFFDAGHILGSASIVLDINRPYGRRRLAFSGDIGRVGLPLLRDPEIPHDVDWLIMEATYGAREHDPITEAKDELVDTIKRTVARGGKIIVPSFSVERTQGLIYHLHELKLEGRLPPIPIYVDSPLAINVTEIFRQHTECFDGETHDYILNNQDPFGFNQLTYVRDVEHSKRLNDIRMPCMIISASGMCEAGRIRHHLSNSISDAKNTVMFVGYQAEGTLGRKIVERNPEVNIFGEPHFVRAEIVTLNTMSGHADRNDLFDYARTVAENSRLKRIFLVHGEPDALEALGARLNEELKVKVEIPALGDTHRLE